MKKKKGQKSIKGTLTSLKSKVKALLDSKVGSEFSDRFIIKRLGFKNKRINGDINQAIKELVLEKSIKITKNGNYVSTKKLNTLKGIVDHVSSRFAYVNIGGDKDDIYIKDRDLNSAMHEDEVEIMILDGRVGKRLEGKVVQVVRRAHTAIVGKIQISPRYGFVIADNKKIHTDIFIDKSDFNGAKNNEKVIVNITEWAKGSDNPKGKVIRILGTAGENNTEIHSIMAEYGLPFEFPEKVLDEAQHINPDFNKEAKNRRDLRKTLTFTIDPADAKDFDDAISFKILDNGNYEIGVHIADVTHYVKLGSFIEEEALERATSVYLVDRTIPMLPERLSNELCSLRPGEDKMTFSAIFEVDLHGKVMDSWFGRTITHSDHRFSYEDAQEVIEGGEGPFSTELITLNGIAKQLRKDRFNKGAINFETTEVKFRLDENGKPLEIIPKIRKDAHKLIEEYMLLANKSVATFIYKRSKGKTKDTFVYRVHDYPNVEKISLFSQFATKFGHELLTDNKRISDSLNALMTEIQGKPEENILQTIAIRAMAKAIYTTEEKGHFGLAFDHYTHFTSPIRRYPDMMVHRLLQHYLDGGKSADKDEYEEMCLHSSEREKRAAEAERASIKYKQVEYMASSPDKDYDGIISGVTEWGIYVEIVETKCEGMVRLSDLKDDFYEFDDRNYRIVGRATNNSYQLGDEVKVRIKRTDIDKRLIDLEFVFGI